jgi:PAS domain S-box-containing protein
MSTLTDASQAAKAELLDLLLSATQDGIVEWDLRTGETVYNARWKHLLGFDSAELAEYHETPDAWRRLIHPDDAARALRLIDDHVTQGWPLYTTVRMRHLHASYKHVLVRGAALRDEADRAVRMVLVFSDIDERIRDEQRHRAELMQAYKLGVMRQLASRVAHEINTPLQLVGDNLHVAQSVARDLLGLLGGAPTCVAGLEPRGEADIDLDRLRETLPAALERSREGVEQITEIVRAIKSIATPDGERLVPADLKSLIESSVMVAASEWRHVADLELRLSPDLPPVPCLSRELSQVLLDLVSNAAHAVADAVGTSGIKGKISIGADHDASHVVLRVSDTGTGIPEHARGKVFHPFFTTKEAGKGSGQSLSMAYDCIVERHHGSIDFETQLGVGTTFVIRLPLNTPPRDVHGVTT